MKKKLFAIAALLMTFGHVLAQTSLTAENVTVPQNGQAYLVMNYQFDSSVTYAGYSIDISLPEGLSLAKNTAGKYDYEKGDCYSETHTFTLGYNKDRKNYVVACISLDGDIMTGTTGTLIKIGIQADETLSTGEELTGYLKNIEFARANGSSESLEGEIPFTIIIGEPGVVLDENSTTMPPNATGTNVTVKRTIKAGSWSTICLPFAMNDLQCTEAFGSGVEIAEFIGTESDVDENDNVIGIKASFESVNSMDANHPYIIKVMEPVTKFSVKNVDVNPDEDACIEYDNGKSGSRRVVYSGFYGNYVAGTVLEKNTLFLSDNKFYYSVGNTKMKGFRAYFDFLDVLTSVENAGAKISFFVDGVTDGIDSLTADNGYIDGAVYTLGGQLVGKNVSEKLLKRGVYIKDGKKFVVK